MLVLTEDLKNSSKVFEMASYSYEEVAAKYEILTHLKEEYGPKIK